MTQRRLSRKQRDRILAIQERRRQRAVQKGARRGDEIGSSGLGPEQHGLIIANFGPAAVVENQAGVLYRCTVRQNLSMLVCGDRVVWQPSGEREGVVIAVEERHSVLSRPDYSGRSKPMAANLDQVAVIVAPRPELNEFLIDRYLAVVVLIGIAPLLVLNKIDLLDAEGLQVLEDRLASYRRIGYPVLHASTRTAHGLEELQHRLSGRTSILVGQSGVGKSSLIRALLPDQEIRIEALSEATGLGTHATTTSTLYHLPKGGDLIDSPGVRSFELGQVDPDTLQKGFVELTPFLGRCRFSDCSHTVEPGCALREAVERGEIDPRRLESYHQLKSTLVDLGR